MRRTRFSLTTGFALGLLAALWSCGSPATSTDTTVLVTIEFTPQNGTRAFFLSGEQSGGGDAFTPSYRPESISTVALLTPQTVRIYLTGDATSTPFTLKVSGINEFAAEVEYGEAAVTPVPNTEVTVTVHLEKAASPDAGTQDAGVTDAGTPPACSCTTDCCGNQGTCTNSGQAQVSYGTFVVQGCGAAGRQCTSACNSYNSDATCPDATGECTCGGVVCGAGLRCNNHQCVCDEFSGCLGCCTTFNGNQACITGNQLTTGARGCGAAGRTCTTCTSNTTGCASGVCGLIGASKCAESCDGARCCTADACEDTAFPTCRMPAGAPDGPPAGVCIPCDVVRSNHCLPAGGCACGDRPGPCDQNQLCVKGGQPDGGFGCVRVF